jgi:drug/metabolite transporter (DMT)-like permease
VTGAQTLVFALIAEFFSLRNALLHMFFAAAAAAGGFFLIWPSTAEEMDAGRWADIGIIAGAGLVAGLVYWLIAGRDAGFRRPLSPHQKS